MRRAHAPLLRKSNSGMPSFFALSARLSWMAVPGNTTIPIGRTSSIVSLRLNGAAFRCFVQSVLNAMGVTHQLSAHFCARARKRYDAKSSDPMRS